MKQNEFIKIHEPFWLELEEFLNSEDYYESDDSDIQQLPADYRRLCHHLSLAKLRNYSPALQHRLNQLALKGHQVFYSRKSEKSSDLGEIFATDFPRAVRKNKYYVLLSAILFFVPLFGLMFGVMNDPNLAFTVVSPSDAEQFKDMYEQKHADKDRDSTDDLYMFGFYIYNNISIALRTFASGLVLGIGAILILLFNGTYIGTVSGIIASAGFADNFFTFVVGHGSFELTAIVLAGACGMKLGFSILMPGRFSRTQALRNSAIELAPIIYGFVLMLFIAAAIEAFWSPNGSVPGVVKYWVGGILWFLVIGFFITAGRNKKRS